MQIEEFNLMTFTPLGMFIRTNARRYVEDKGLAAMLATKRNKAAHHGHGTLWRRRHQKSKTVVSVPPQKGLMSSKNFKKGQLPEVFELVVIALPSFVVLTRQLISSLGEVSCWGLKLQTDI